MYKRQREIPTGGSPYAAAFTRFGLPAAEVMVNVVVFTAVISVLNSGLYTSSRMLFALQRRGFAPGWVRDINRRRVPWKAILLSTLVGYAAVAASYVSPDTIFYFVINSAGAVALFIYGMIAVSQLRMRRRLEREMPERLKLRMWFFPYLTWATLIVIAAVVVTMGAIEEARSQLTLSLVSFAGIVLSYLLFVRRRVAKA